MQTLITASDLTIHIKALMINYRGLLAKANTLKTGAIKGQLFRIMNKLRAKLAKVSRWNKGMAVACPSENIGVSWILSNI